MSTTCPIDWSSFGFIPRACSETGQAAEWAVDWLLDTKKECMRMGRQCQDGKWTETWEDLRVHTHNHPKSAACMGIAFFLFLTLCLLFLKGSHHHRAE